nr:MAG TPA: HIRAN protein [Caudoviricetes sp.]
MTKYVALKPSKRPTVALVGEFAYSDALQQVPSGEVWLEIVPEPDNPYDSRAISVRYNNKVIGYVPRARTKTYWNTIARVAASGMTARSMGRVARHGTRTEVSIFLLTGDQAFNRIEGGLVPESSNYLVPNAYSGPPGGDTTSQPASTSRWTTRPENVVQTVNQEPANPRRNAPPSTWLPNDNPSRDYPRTRQEKRADEKPSFWRRFFWRQ